MKSVLTMLRWLIVGALSLGGVSALADSRGPIRLAQNAPPGSAPAPVNMQETAPGDHWVYEVKDEISGTTKEPRKQMVTEVSKGEIAIHVEFGNSGRSNNLVFDRSWNMLRNNAYKFSPNDGSGVKLPLTLDAQWKFAVDEINFTSGGTWKRTGNSRVTGQETITTKAGQFDTFIIETNVTTRNVKDPTHISEISMRTWFNPDVNHWVKRTIITRQQGHVFGNETVVLVEYGRKQQ